MRKSLYALLALIVINSNSVIASNPVAKLDFGQAVSVSHPGLGKCEWSYDGYDFYITHKSATHVVDPVFVDKELRGISKKNLLRFLQYGYLYINQMDDGEFTIKAKGRMKGGEPFTLMLIGSMACSALISLARNANKPTTPARDYDFIEYHQAMLNHQEKQKIVAKKRQEPLVIEKKEVPLEKVIKHAHLQDKVIHGNGNRVKITDDVLKTCPSNEKVFGIPEKGIAERHCIVGPGVPIGPVPFPHPRPPLIRAVKGLPILPGKTTLA